MTTLTATMAARIASAGNAPRYVACDAITTKVKHCDTCAVEIVWAHDSQADPTRGRPSHTCATCGTGAGWRFAAIVAATGELHKCPNYRPRRNGNRGFVPRTPAPAPVSVPDASQATTDAPIDTPDASQATTDAPNLAIVAMLSFARGMRANIRSAGDAFDITPRDTTRAARMLANGFTHAEILESAFRKDAIGADAWRKYTYGVGTFSASGTATDVRKVGTHARTGFLRRMLAIGETAYLCGPAGTGKTTAALMAASESGRSFLRIQSHANMSDIDFVGFVSPVTGEYKKTAFVDAWINGNVVILIDEIDAGTAEGMLFLNGILDGSTEFTLPNGEIAPRGENISFVVTANTFGTGADAKFVGRNPLDFATLNRMAPITWDIDEALEFEICTKAFVPVAMPEPANAFAMAA